MGRALVIAEAGVNHNGDINLAYKLVDAAKAAGADIVKFQTGKAELVVSRFAAKAEYQKRTTGAQGSQLEMCRKISLEYEDFIHLNEYCNKVGIEFLSTPFEIESVHFLQGLGCRMWKVPSGEITNYPYLIEVAKTGKPVIMSTGMSTLNEVQAAIELLRKNGSGEILLLHCTTEYPTPYSDVNLRAMDTIREKFHVKVGYSDHTLGIEVPIAAVARGAVVIEKHFTLDRNMEGPDHKASLEPDELKRMIDAIRHIEAAMGDGKKTPASSEIKNIAIARKSIVAKRDIRKGEMLTEENITTKRPGSGISPMRWTEILGTKAVRDFKEDELIEL